MTAQPPHPERSAKSAIGRSPAAAVPPRIVMLVANNFRHDTRVYKEARSLIEWGCEVHVLAMAAPDLPAREIQDGILVQRLPHPRGVLSAICGALIPLVGWSQSLLRLAVTAGLRKNRRDASAASAEPRRPS